MTPERRPIRVALASWVCASIEWYDFFIYGTASATVFPSVFFPSQLPLVGTLLSFATFGVAFVARPLGGALFGHIGDSRGRKRALIAALVAMGGATTLIGLLPGYAEIGVAAPIALVVLRFVQGMAVGGQQGGVVVLATEAVPANRGGVYGSFASAGAPGGVILANLAFLAVASALSPEEIRAWGWRLPFLASLLVVAVAVLIQARLEETGEIRPAGQAGSPVLEAVRRHPRAIMLAAGCYLAINLNYYIFNTFLLAYAPHAGISPRIVLTAVLVASAIELICLPAAGWASDRFGRRRVFGAGAVLLGAWAFPFWALVDTGSTWALLLALVVGLGVLHSLMYGAQPAMFSEAFSGAVRYSGVSLGIQLGSLLGGAFAPLLATAMLARFGGALPIACYMAAGCAVTLVSGMALRRHLPATSQPRKDSHARA
ncbi:MFS transporter [Pseudonocardia eucalypti]|uniref:MFS transporter n=1 Tax=Pseudonocardia eucalypti TaxID=648755 RepID=A0ABP9Q4A6_9PSEU|nr:MFS family permease [Pseudonocardia eucalypti]